MNSKKKIIIIVVAAVLVLAIAIGIAVKIAGGKSKEEETQVETTGSVYTEETEPESSAPVTEATIVTTTETTTVTTTAPTTIATTVPTTAAPTQAPVEFDLNKKGELFKANCEGKIWANVVGTCYIVFKNIDEPNEWGEKGMVYEIYVAQVGNNYSMWSDGYWNLNGDTLTLNPVNQSQNGNVGCDEGSSVTINGNGGVFEIPLTFEQGGKTVCTLNING